MTTRPILFSAPMIRAILEGRKTQTRRIAKMKEVGYNSFHPVQSCAWGDRLYVREAWSGIHEDKDIPPGQRGVSPVWYWADGNPEHGDWERPRPGIHMPRWASRLTLDVTSVRCERLCDISEADAKAEGAMFHDGGGIGHSGWRHDFKDVHDTARSSFARLWDDINGPTSFNRDPWVTVITFTAIKENVDKIKQRVAA